ncbi:MAG: capsule assembly Wzi family protein, partial [Chloroflexi bacterium]
MLNFPKFYSVILVCWAVAGKGLMGGLFFLGLFVFFPLQAFASPWVSPGDLLLRHDIQLLSDSGYLTSPSQSWPLPWADLRDVAAYSGQAESAGLEQALNRVRRRFRAASRLGLSQHGGADLNIHPQVFRDFSASPRESGEAFSAIHWLGWRFASQLQVEMVSGPDDGQRVRFDDSWVAATLGNWIVSFGAQDRWWGPGWDGSLILSTSARPVPALSFQRKQALPFNWPLLSFLGPWRLEGFVGQLEGDRAVSHAKLLGLRLSFKPWSDLEVGLSRTAQWGGNGRPENFTSLVNLILGRDNRGDSGINVNNEPGNQLGGVDWRLHTRLISSLDLAFYGQIVGEDEANGLPSRPIGLAGLEHAG